MSILVKKNPVLNALARHVNDMLRDLCVINDFDFICNDVITTKSLGRWSLSTRSRHDILSNYFIEFVDKQLFSNSHDRFWLSESHQTNNFDSDIDGLINFRKTYQTNPLIGYMNINYFRILTEKKHSQIKLQRLQKVRIWIFG